MKLFKVLFNENQNEIIPEEYLRASGESLFLMLLVGALSSITFVPEVYLSNPILERMGYNNLCVGFDMAPSTYFSFPFGIITIYLVFQFNIYDRLRAKLSNRVVSNWKTNFAIFTNNTYIISASLFPLILLINPMVDIWVHSLLFLQMVFFRALVVLGNYFEHPSPNTRYTIYVYIYMLVSTILPIMAVVNYINYDNQIALGAISVSPVIPAGIGQSIDLTWFLLIFLGNLIVQPGEKINVKYSIKS